MINEAHFNTPITVTAVMDLRGQITPTNLTWQGEKYILTAIGRQWEDKSGRHVLVEAANGDRFEIELSRQNLLWYLKRAWQNTLLV